jgi:hypothetical protein
VRVRAALPVLEREVGPGLGRRVQGARPGAQQPGARAGEDQRRALLNRGAEPRGCGRVAELRFFQPEQRAALPLDAQRVGGRRQGNGAQREAFRTLDLREREPRGAGHQLRLPVPPGALPGADAQPYSRRAFPPPDFVDVAAGRAETGRVVERRQQRDGDLLRPGVPQVE